MISTSLISFLVIFVLSFSLAAAVTVDVVDGDEFSGSQTAGIEIAECTGLSTLQLTNPSNQLIFVDQGSDAWDTTYNTASDPADGRYTLTASCADGTTATQSFCVDAPGCLDTTAEPPTRRGTGGSCFPQWSCGAWSFCNATLQHSRECTDLEYCFNPRTEVESCPTCEESWTCSAWGPCQNGQQARTCADAHACGTTALRPAVQQSCTSGGVPATTTGRQPPAVGRPPVEQPAVPGFWETYGSLILLIAGIIIVLSVIIVLLAYHFQGGKKVYNSNELRRWIQQEKAMGTNNEDIKDILAQHTGWSKIDIENAFGELRAMG